MPIPRIPTHTQIILIATLAAHAGILAYVGQFKLAAPAALPLTFAWAWFEID
jgi:hypothetical protein